MEDVKKQFKRLRELLTDHCIRGLVHYRIWQAINESFGGKPKPSENAPVFFVMTHKAHFDAAFAHLARLLDSHKDSTNIEHYLNFIESNASIFRVSEDTINESVRQDRQLLAELRPIIENVRGLRNNYYSHLSRSAVPNPSEVFKKFPVRPLDIEQLFKKVGEILNRNSGYFDDSESQIGFVGEDDVVWLIDFIDKCLTHDDELGRGKLT